MLQGALDNYHRVPKIAENGDPELDARGHTPSPRAQMTCRGTYPAYVSLNDAS
jgi:hypothetical protein